MIFYEFRTECGQNSRTFLSLRQSAGRRQIIESERNDGMRIEAWTRSSVRAYSAGPNLLGYQPSAILLVFVYSEVAAARVLVHAAGAHGQVFPISARVVGHIARDPQAMRVEGQVTIQDRGNRLVELAERSRSTKPASPRI